MDTIIVHDVLYPSSADLCDWSRGDITIRRGEITAIGGRADQTAATLVNGSGMVALPGLRNMHTHAHDLLWRGARDGRTLDDENPPWFDYARAKTPVTSYVTAAAATYAKSLYGGVTYIADHLRHGLSADPFITSLDVVGMKGMVYCSAANGSSGALAIPHETHPDFASSIRRAAVIGTVPLMLHAQETERRTAYQFQQWGISTIELLDRYGLLHNETLLVHLCYYSRRDLELIAKRGAKVVVTPSAEMKLGERTFDVHLAAHHGFEVRVGSDGPAFNRRDDMFEELRILALQMSLAHGPSAVDCSALLRMATASGAADGSQGIAVGSLANLVVLDIGHSPIADSAAECDADVASRIIYAAAKELVRHVISQGRLVICDGAIQAHDDVARGFGRPTYNLEGFG